jgi:hypothetical protein
MHTIGSVEHSHAPVAPRQEGLNRGVQADFSGWVRATSDPTELELGEAGFTYPDLFDPARLAELTDRFDAYFLGADADAFARFAAYRKTGGQGVKPEEVSEVLLAVAPHVSRFVARLFLVEAETGTRIREAKERSSLWHFKKEFVKKRLFKATAGKAWSGTPVEAAHAARRALTAMGAPAELLARCS